MYVPNPERGNEKMSLTTSHLKRDHHDLSIVRYHVRHIHNVVGRMDTRNTTSSGRGTG